jgi:hypothetical protein
MLNAIGKGSHDCPRGPSPTLAPTGTADLPLTILSVRECLGDSYPDELLDEEFG